MRYKVHGAWELDGLHGSVNPSITIEHADLLDTRSGDIFRQGAFRVLVDGKPVKGKGGSTPFIGETAWSDAERLARDLYFAARYK